MIVRKCDICGKQVSSEMDLLTLESYLQTSIIQHICNNCNKRIVNKSAVIMDLISGMKTHFLKEYMKNLKEKYIESEQ